MGWFIDRLARKQTQETREADRLHARDFHCCFFVDKGTARSTMSVACSLSEVPPSVAHLKFQKLLDGLLEHFLIKPAPVCRNRACTSTASHVMPTRVCADATAWVESLPSAAASKAAVASRECNRARHPARDSALSHRRPCPSRAVSVAARKLTRWRIVPPGSLSLASGVAQRDKDACSVVLSMAAGSASIAFLSLCNL